MDDDSKNLPARRETAGHRWPWHRQETVDAEFAKPDETGNEEVPASIDKSVESLREIFPDPRPNGSGASEMEAMAKTIVQEERRKLWRRRMDDVVAFASGMRGALGGAGIGVAGTLTIQHLLSLWG
jgi:hypothetical protein